MRDETKASLVEMLERQEGYRQYPYKCPAGYWTVGIGRNLEANGIDHNEAIMLLDSDITKCESELLRAWPEFMNLNEARQVVVLNMCFQMGVAGFMMFTSTRRHMEAQECSDASEHMLDSRWHSQTPSRCEELALIMATGELP